MTIPKISKVVEIDISNFSITTAPQTLTYNGMDTIGYFLPQVGITKEAVEWCEQNGRILLVILPIYTEKTYFYTPEQTLFDFLHVNHPEWETALKALNIDFEFTGSHYVNIIRMHKQWYEEEVTAERLLEMAKTMATEMEEFLKKQEPWKPVSGLLRGLVK